MRLRKLLNFKLCGFDKLNVVLHYTEMESLSDVYSFHDCFLQLLPPSSVASASTSKASQKPLISFNFTSSKKAVGPSAERHQMA